jgi:hypothetical protein
MMRAAYLSTANQVSDISGRGVGMDAVRNFCKKQETASRYNWARKATGLLPLPVPDRSAVHPL